MSDVLEPERDGAGFNANDRILKETADWLSRQGARHRSTSSRRGWSGR
jgi:hypothetical protein